MNYRTFDIKVLHFFRLISVPISRLGIFVVFFWFGILKVFSLSPASPLVLALLSRTMPFIPPETFLVFFGVLECFIGLLFLIKGAERIAITILFLHMITTFMPLILLPQVTWSGILVPTLEGQYIIKNLAIIAAAIGIAAHLHPLQRGWRFFYQ
ncbi:MAG TPA: hypothetical protein VJH63_00840 [Candidatus Paceibacterota bacterium]